MEFRRGLPGSAGAAFASARAAPCWPVGLDGGHVRDSGGKRRHFEVIVGKAFSEERPARCFGLVQGYDTKPRRRLFEVLRDQGLQFNQQLTFVSDGADTVRDLQLYLSPEAEHVLHWFHVAMPLTALGKYAKGLARTPTRRGQSPPREEALTLVERTKHYLWHGNLFRALQTLDELDDVLWVLAAPDSERRGLGRTDR